MTWSTLKKAPIVEALLDVQVRLPPATDVTALSNPPSDVRTRYPTRTERTRTHHAFSVQGGEIKTTSQATQVDGYLFRSADQKHVFQNRLDGFSFSRLAPYENWAAFSEEARARWRDYRSIASIQVITRVGLRFVNRIELPRKAENFRAYFRTFPDLPNSLPHTLAGLFMRVALPVESATVILTLAVDEQSLSEVTIPFILDIDAFEFRAFDVRSDDDVWATVEKLRRLKNWFFFESITPRMKEMFE